jgi:hypothetical protein
MDLGRRLRIGDPAPVFPGGEVREVLTALGHPASLGELIADGPVVLVFLRGFM